MATFKREMHKNGKSIACQLEGALLISKETFPYFMLIALEAGSPVRALVLFLISPIIWFLDIIGMDEEIGLDAMIFVSTVGLKLSDIKAVANATLPKFFLEDIRESAHRLLSRCGGDKYVLTRMPRIIVEAFLKNYLEVDHVIGMELKETVGGYCMGRAELSVGGGGGGLGLEALSSAPQVTGDDNTHRKEIDVGLGDGLRDYPFMSLCKEPYLITPEEKPSSLARWEYPKPLIFHDGRLGVRPTQLVSLLIVLWLPAGIVLAICRVLVGLLIPYKLVPLFCAATGIQIRSQIPDHIKSSNTKGLGVGGRLYVCCHRTLLDPIFISIALQRRVSAVTYSLSRLSELISPIPTVRLTRRRSSDDAILRGMLKHSDVVVCPEGTTCREPYLLRFSPLFVEITDNFVPVAATTSTETAGLVSNMFYGTTVRGYKCLDSFFFLTNPIPSYNLQFLHPPSSLASANLTDLDCKKKHYCEVANRVQESIGEVLGFKCTDFTRKDKYRMLAGYDGTDSRCQP